MEPIIKCCSDQAQTTQAQRLRYDIYADEMGRYQAVADHQKRLLIEPEDEYSRHYLCLDDGRPVGTMRHTWGADRGFSKRQEQQYSIESHFPFLQPEDMIIGERFMVLPEYRGTPLLFNMFRTFLEFANQHRIQLIIGDCEPHLLNLYLGLGFQTYSRSNINSTETGYLIPLVLVVEDIDYLRRIESPLTPFLKDFGADRRIPSQVPELVSSSAVLSQRITGDAEYWSEVFASLTDLAEPSISIFAQLSEDEIRLLLEKSSVIECRSGDHVIKQGNVTHNLFIVLDGLVEVKDGATQLAIIGPGEMFGEMAFLLNAPRSKDVHAMSDDVRVLSISESVLKGLIDKQPDIAARLMVNISKILCIRLAKMRA